MYFQVEIAVYSG